MMMRIRVRLSLDSCAASENEMVSFFARLRSFFWFCVEFGVQIEINESSFLSFWLLKFLCLLFLLVRCSSQVCMIKRS